MAKIYMKVFFASFLLFTILNGFITTPSTSANEGEEIEEKINSFREEQQEKEIEADRTEEELEEIEEELNVAESEIRQLDEAMADTNQQIDAKQTELDETTERVEKLREDIIELEERIAERDELLKERVKSMYQSGGNVNYIEVILGSQSFGDLIERVSALHSIAKSDRSILEQHVEDMEALEIAKQSLENELASLEEQMAELENLRTQLEGQVEEKNDLMEELQGKGYILEGNLMSLEEEQSLLKAQEEAAEKELAEWEEEQRRIEEERRKKEEEERRQREEEERKQREQEQRQQEQEQQQQQQQQQEQREQEQASQSSPSPSTSSGESAQTSSGGSAIFHRPSDGRVTSSFNPSRVHPVRGTVSPHNGTDFGGRNGRNIYAAEAGTVISAGWMGGYGNTILISHVVDGKSITTLYAHLSSFNVSAGNRVSRGENIATMGTTGVSTGIHLHFEVHPGGYSGGSSAVNPSSYLP
ncbi:murein hydrolase activator EnvC family protein [Salipaludibacillus sp. HK11]|uniref:murein hydrolase activator EnvC family protein n=1 Tax=Salipaludibacillus sp. HK11 TaxID=3394320 RepID=UPI0039FD07E9